MQVAARSGHYHVKVTEDQQKQRLIRLSAITGSLPKSNDLPVVQGQFGVSRSGGLIAIEGLQPVGDTVEPRGLGAEAVSAAPASRPRPPVAAVIPVQVVACCHSEAALARAQRALPMLF